MTNETITQMARFDIQSINIRPILLEDIIKYLRDLATGKIPKSKDLGICFNLDNFIEHHPAGLEYVCGYKIVEALSVGWKHHSGNAVFPVDVYTIVEWNSKRRDLCNYIANRLEDNNGSFIYDPTQIHSSCQKDLFCKEIKL